MTHPGETRETGGGRAAGCKAPVAIECLLEDPDLVRRLSEANQPYLPVQRYFQNQAEYAAASGGRPMIIAPNFRGDWAYDQPLVDGVEPLLHHPALIDAARTVFGCEQVRPQQVYANFTWQLPFPQGPGHTDVPAFRGIDRTRFPTTFLQMLGCSRLFEPYRIRIATAVAWFYRGADGGFEYWPDGPGAAPRLHEGEIFNTALVGDNDFMFHRVRPVGAPENGLPGGMTLGTCLEHVAGDRWRVREGNRVLGEMAYDELRISVSWKAMVFADATEARVYDEHSDDLSLGHVLDKLYADLETRGEKPDRVADPIRDSAFAESLARAYATEPSVYA